MQFWDQQFSAPGYKYGTRPNAFLMEQSHRLTSRSDVLLPGDGEGRNSVWLAASGHHVTALDSSVVGLKKASELAAINKVSIRTLHADLQEWNAPTSSFDAIVSIFLHLPPHLREATHSQLVLALRPGGWLVVEAFHPKQLGNSSGGPKDVSLLYTAEMLRSDFIYGSNGCIQEVLSWEGETSLDEGPGHQGTAYVTRYVARRRVS